MRLQLSQPRQLLAVLFSMGLLIGFFVSMASAQQVQSVGFVYRLETTARFLAARDRLEQLRHRPATIEELLRLARESYLASSVERPLERWRELGGPNPWVFQAQLRVKNSKMLSSRQQQRVAIWGLVGPWMADPDLLLTDYDYLLMKAQWRKLGEAPANVPSLAGGEYAQVRGPVFELAGFLWKYPNQWPWQLKACIVTSTGQDCSAPLTLVPDHFVVPIERKLRLLQ